MEFCDQEICVAVQIVAILFPVEVVDTSRLKNEKACLELEGSNKTLRLLSIFFYESSKDLDPQDSTTCLLDASQAIDPCYEDGHE